ncbi:hypothetical protein [Senegalia sp. (in: firmicutes)]|uniref:hypothetical protein n=1 Tax=Senegalia sp. (in: firmicutes) TaxID=1924098 RepID=UPI003F9EA9C8
MLPEHLKFDYDIIYIRIKKVVFDLVFSIIGVDYMKKLKSEKKLCLICMEEHEVDIVEMIDTEIFKGEEVTFKAIYEYCNVGDELLETEEMIRANSLAMKDAYKIMDGYKKL